MPKAEGPYKIIKKVNQNAYKVELPSTYKISNTFNVSDLAEYKEDTMSTSNAVETFQEWENDGGPSSLALQAVLDMGLGLDSISEVDEDTPSEDGLSESDMFNLKLQLLLGPLGVIQTIIFEDNN